MLKKTLIALAAISSIAVMLPAQARDGEQSDHETRHHEVRHHQSPQIHFFVNQHSERSQYRHHRYEGHPQYRHHSYRENHGMAHGGGHRQHYQSTHHRNHH